MATTNKIELLKKIYRQLNISQQPVVLNAKIFGDVDKLNELIS